MHRYVRPREPQPIGKEDWSRPLSRAVSATNGRTMHTFADVRGQILAMPPERQNLPAWRYATGLLMTAARNEVDTREATIAVEMALHRDGRLADITPILALEHWRRTRRIEAGGFAKGELQRSAAQRPLNTPSQPVGSLRGML
jgi:hypothetical protein